MSSAVPPPGVSIADARLHEVASGVYAYVQPDGTWWINNTGFLTGPQGVISIDSCSTQRRTRAYQEAIATVTPAPVRAVINTHHHGDHTFGNCMFPGAAIVAHERARAEAIAFGPPRELLSTSRTWTRHAAGAPVAIARTREVGILPCVGARARHIRRVFSAEAPSADGARPPVRGRCQGAGQAAAAIPACPRFTRSRRGARYRSGTDDQP
jgi:Metallo-beta-lactamase superfamily